MKIGDTVTYKENGKKYIIKQLHPTYGWIEAKPVLDIQSSFSPGTLYNKLAKDFIEEKD